MTVRHYRRSNMAQSNNWITRSMCWSNGSGEHKVLSKKIKPKENKMSDHYVPWVSFDWDMVSYRQEYGNMGHRPSKAVWYVLHRPGSRHCHLAIGHCTIHQQVFDCKYSSCKICFNMLNYVFSLFIFNLYCLVNIQQPCHNSSHRDWHIIYSKAVMKLYNNVMPR